MFGLMVDWTLLISIVAGVFLVIGIGGGLRRLEWLTHEADESLLNVLVRLLVPCLIFDSVAGNERLLDAANVVLPPVVGFVTVGLGIGAALLAATVLRRWMRLDRRAAIGTFALATGLYNFGYVPIPLVTELFDEQTLGVLFVHNLGIEVAVWTIGVLLLAGQLDRHWWKRVINGPTVAIAVSLAVNFTGLHRYVPGFAEQAIHLLAMAAIPLGVLLVGATMADHLQGGLIRDGGRVIAVGLVLRLALLPIVFLLIARYLPASVELKRVIVVQAAMPSATFPIVLAKHYGGDPATALRISLCTSVIGIVTIPLWLAAGMSWVGLG